MVFFFAKEFRRSFAWRVWKIEYSFYNWLLLCLSIQRVIKSLISGIEIRKICNFQNDVFPKEIKVWNQPFLKYSLLKSQSKFVIKLNVFYNVPIYQAHGIYYFKTKERFLTLRTSGLYMKIDCLTSVQNLSVDNLKVYVIILRLHRNTN